MTRGTTPTLRIKVVGIDVTELDELYLTIKQGKTEITKRESDISTDAENNKILVPLSQQETLRFNDGFVSIQLRAITVMGNAIASTIKTIPLSHILMEGEI